MSDEGPSRWSLQGLKKQVEGRLPQMTLPDWPQLGKEIELPVYIVHNSPDAEDYFFIFDFEDFVEASRAGLFVRPKLKVWAGRSDFGKRRFARQFRESFGREFDIARAQLADQQKKPKGWFSFLRESVGDAGSVSQIAANIVLLAGLGLGKMVMAQILPKGWLGGPSDARKLEEAISETQVKVDAALENLEIVLHPELYSFAYKGQPPGKLTGMDYDAWPLPDYVRAHLEDGQSGSWW